MGWDGMEWDERTGVYLGGSYLLDTFLFSLGFEIRGF